MFETVGRVSGNTAIFYAYIILEIISHCKARASRRTSDLFTGLKTALSEDIYGIFMLSGKLYFRKEVGG